MSVLTNSKNPALVLVTPLGGAGGTNPPIPRKAKVPMAVSVQGGIARPGLYVVGSPRPAIEVPDRIDVQALADALNAQLNGAEPTAEVTKFYVLMAGAFGAGVEHQASLMGVA